MLEERNVVPIDVARHPQASTWHEHLRHRYATEWILHTLEKGRPYDVTKWPSPPDWAHHAVPELLQPVEEVTINVPMKEPQREIATESSKLHGQVRAIVQVWEHNRKVYPGWLIMPPNKHFLVQRSIGEWEQLILQILSEFSLLERLTTIRELVWLRDNLLEPLSENVEAVVQSILNDIDCQTRKIGGAIAQSVKWIDIREAWRDLALTLLTSARLRQDRESFDRRLEALRPFLNDHPDIIQRVYHERSLWALNSTDYSVLDELMKEWSPEGCDPIWMSRKAAILAEMDRNDEAVRLLNRSLSIVREATNREGNFASPSREGWILWLALAFEENFLGTTNEALNSPPAFKRWEQLAALQCDAFTQKNDFLSKLQSDPEKKEPPLFDFGLRQGKRIHFLNAKYDRRIAPLQVVRLCEVAGLPPSASHMVITSDLLALAADQLAFTNLALALRLALRVAESEDDKTFNRVWARPHVAVIPIKDVNTLIDLNLNVISYSLPKVSSSSSKSLFWVTRLRVAMEALSRLVLRLSPERAESIFKQALNYYSTGAIASDTWLSKPMNHLLARAWEALPKSHRADLVFDILSAPISGLKGFKTYEFYPEPGELIIDDDKIPSPARLPETEERWKETIQLILSGLRSGGEARKRAAIRLVPLTLWGILTDLERNLFAQALWRVEDSVGDTLPTGTTLLDWIFLLLPQPEPGLAERLFRKKWFDSKEPSTERALNEYLGGLGEALAGLKHRHNHLILCKKEQAKLIAMVERWILLPGIQNDNPMNDLGIHQGITGLQFILREIELPPNVANSLFDKIEILSQKNVPGFRIISSLCKFLPDRLEDIAIAMRVGLASNNTDYADDAVMGLHLWLKDALEQSISIPPPPDDLLREIGVIIAIRRKGVLNRALQVARWVFTSGSMEQRFTIASLTLSGLRYLIQELSYERGDYGEKEETEIPLLRWGCAHLALAMTASGYGNDPTVAQWAEIANIDPLPEVRYAEVLASDHTQKEN